MKTEPWALAALGRPEAPVNFDPLRIPNRVLVTGAGGSIGSAIADYLDRADFSVLATDVESLDVTLANTLSETIMEFEPGLIIHMAGAKHAPAGEEDPVTPFNVHVAGTANVVMAANMVNARVVMASTCKACDPETAYGASKLMAERLVLNAGGTVVRFYNVVETQGNVFEIWRDAIQNGYPLEVTPCRRRFISFIEATSLTLWASSDTPPGRYTNWPSLARAMWTVADEVYPHHEKVRVPQRRGDRLAEPEHAACETSELFARGVARIVNPHDRERELA